MTTTTLERPKLLMLKKRKNRRQGDWDWRGLSDDEIRIELQAAVLAAKKEFSEGKCQPVDDFFKEWDRERGKCVTTE